MSDASLYNALILTRDRYGTLAQKRTARGDILGALEAQGIATGAERIAGNLDTLKEGQPMPLPGDR